MKSLLVIRHAKSSWEDISQKDFDRPLNDRGRRDAPAMAAYLLKSKVIIDAFISSPALRAITTCQYFAHAYGLTEKKIIIANALYEASPGIFYEVIGKTNDAYNHVALFAHNPGITVFVNELTQTMIDNMPTCSVFAVKIPIKHWKDFGKAEKEFWFFHQPKKM
jgi:phosphohistidine phosphatase